MTSPSPTAVTYEYDADYLHGDEWRPLPVTLIIPSVDADRVPYAQATLTLAALDDATFDALDPRTLYSGKIGQVRWRIRQLDLAGNILGYLPRAGATVDDYATMHVRTITRTLEAVTVNLSGGEALLDDKLCILPSDGPGDHATSRQMLDWVLELVIGRTRPGANPPSRVIASDDYAAEVIDRTYLWGNPSSSPIMFGATYLNGIETDLNSVGVRLVDAWGIGWYAATRGLPPTYDGAPNVVKLGTYTTDATHTLPDDVDPIIIDLDQTISRDGDWADAVVLTGPASEGLYVNRWQQAAGIGTYRLDGYILGQDAIAALDAHTRGRTVSIDRAAPAGNLAESVASRAITRGHDITLTARSRFDVLPGMTLEAHMRDQILTGTILAVDWTPMQGTMSIRAQSVTTAPPLSSIETSTGGTAAGPTDVLAGDALTQVIDARVLEAQRAAGTPFKRGRR